MGLQESEVRLFHILKMGFVPFLAKQDRSSGVLKEFEVWFLLYEHEFELRPIIFEVVYYSLYLDLAQPYYGKKIVIPI